MTIPVWVQILELIEEEGGYVRAPEWEAGVELRRNTEISKQIEHINDDEITNSLTAMFEGELIDHTAWNPQEIQGHDRIFITKTGYMMLQDWRSREKQNKLTESTARLTAVLAITAIIQALAGIFTVNGYMMISLSENFSTTILNSAILFATYLILGTASIVVLKQDDIIRY